ncbi:MAG TPA: hypothetical protein VEB70_10155 [Noviherbaspirillum sp.]|nr:hypothetical protein [Noviherbaspirillum sp.]
MSSASVIVVLALVVAAVVEVAAFLAIREEGPVSTRRPQPE